MIHIRRDGNDRLIITAETRAAELTTQVLIVTKTYYNISAFIPPLAVKRNRT